MKIAIASGSVALLILLGAGEAARASEEPLKSATATGVSARPTPQAPAEDATPELTSSIPQSGDPMDADGETISVLPHADHPECYLEEQQIRTSGRTVTRLVEVCE